MINYRHIIGTSSALPEKHIFKENIFAFIGSSYLKTNVNVVCFASIYQSFIDSAEEFVTKNILSCYSTLLQCTAAVPLHTRTKTNKAIK